MSSLPFKILVEGKRLKLQVPPCSYLGGKATHHASLPTSLKVQGSSLLCCCWLCVEEALCLNHIAIAAVRTLLYTVNKRTYRLGLCQTNRLDSEISEKHTPSAYWNMCRHHAVMFWKELLVTLESKQHAYCHPLQWPRPLQPSRQ